MQHFILRLLKITLAWNSRFKKKSLHKFKVLEKFKCNPEENIVFNLSVLENKIQKKLVILKRIHSVVNSLLKMWDSYKRSVFFGTGQLGIIHISIVLPPISKQWPSGKATVWHFVNPLSARTVCLLKSFMWSHLGYCVVS